MVKSALGKSPMAPGSRLDAVLSMQYTVEVWVHLTKKVKDWHGCARSTFAVRAYVGDNDPMGFLGEGCL